jgi:hypothetical protein
MSQMQSSFDARSRFVILWVLATAWFPVLLSLATPWLTASGDLTVLGILSFIGAPIAALGQMALLRGRGVSVWLWLLAGFATAVLFHLVFNIVMVRYAGDIFPRSGGGLSAWLPYFLLSGALAGLALALPQGAVMAYWKLGGGAWILVVLGATIIAAAIGGVIWVMGGAGSGAAEPSSNWAPIVSVAARQIAFGMITGIYMWQRLAQRSVDAAKRVP